MTLYEIVVGRTPFEKDETEEFLTKEGLKEYYSRCVGLAHIRHQALMCSLCISPTHRTLCGRILGEYNVSPLFEDLIRAFIRPDATLRLESATAALAHPFFTSWSTPSSPDVTPFTPPRRRRSVTVDACSAEKPKPRAYTELAQKEVIEGAGLAPSAPVVSLQHKRLAQLVDATSPRRGKKAQDGDLQPWSPRVAVGKASLGTERDRPVDSHSVRTPTTRGQAPGTPRSRRAIRVFEDKVSPSVITTPGRTPSETPRKPLIDRRPNNDVGGSIRVGTPRKGFEGKENADKEATVKLPFAAAKLESEREVKDPEATVRAEPKKKPAPPRIEDVFTLPSLAVPNNTPASSEKPPSSQESTTSNLYPSNSITRLKIDPTKRAALDDFLKSKPVTPTVTRTIAPVTRLTDVDTAGVSGFDPSKRLFPDATGAIVKAKLTPIKPTRLRSESLDSVD